MLRDSVEVLKNLHRALPPRLRAAIPAQAEIWLRRRLVDLSRGLGGGPARALERSLWGGFSAPSLAGLEALRADPAARPGVAAAAALALARWHAASGDVEAALAAMRDLRRVKPRAARNPEQYLREVLFLSLLGRAPEARTLLDARRVPPVFAVTAGLLQANARNPAAGATEPRGRAEAATLAEINAVLARDGLTPLAKRDPDAPLSLDNLGPASPLHRRDGPPVSVIMPLHNAAGTVETALRGLSEQTHADLEILVVDDRSADAGPEIVEAFARADPRVRLIRAPVNGGAYATRNLGLAEARGAFVTTHDADDWSHPERIARHVANLLARDAPFNVSAWARTTSDLVFTGTWRAAARLEERSLASLMVRRAALDLAGPWDTARVSADRELVNRLQRIWGLPRQEPFMEVPLAFARRGASSLTASGPTHVSTMYHGLRREYHEASDFWHDGLDPARVRAGGIEAVPPFFPAPRSLRTNRSAPDATHDLLFIGDFNFLGGTQKSALNMIRAAREAGLDAALLQYRRADQDVTRPLNADVRAMAREHDVRIVAPGEKLRAQTVVATYPPVFDEPLDLFPHVDHDHLLVVVNQMAERDGTGIDQAYDVARVRANLRVLLGSEGSWVPISARVRALMEVDPRYPAPLAETWTPMLDLGLWCLREPFWRGGERTHPVIGRHGRDHPLKWPRDREALRAAYCANRPCEVRFLGGAAHARARAGLWPGNWCDEAFGARDVREFLGDLDFFLHFPDRDYIEEFGRAVMEAMAVGVPAILPPEFEPTFGDAALYTEPEEVWGLVETLWRDRDAWEARAAAGRAFVHANCGWEVFPARLARSGGAAT